MSKLEDTVIDNNANHTGLVVFIIIAAIAGLIIFVVIIFLLISSSRRKYFQNRMVNARRSLTNSIRGRRSQNLSQVSPTGQNIIIDSAYLSPANLIGLSPPKYDSAPPSYDEVISSAAEPSPPYTQSRQNATASRIINSRLNNSSPNDSLTIFPRTRQLEESPSGEQTTAVIQVTEMVTNKPKATNNLQNGSNSSSRNTQIFANNSNIQRPNRLEDGIQVSLDNHERNSEIPNLESIQIS
uniref:Uncharacterized protein n=1 Tax=Parastrongyloides trichosuri TaxID=131310 RepID=A0A0N4ZB50_PARTI